MTPQQRPLDEFNADEDAVTYQCPYCDVSDAREWLVRTHIHRSEDEKHKQWEGFMPEDEVSVLDETSEEIKTIQGNPRRRFETLQNLEPADMPDHLDSVEKQIVLTAVQNLTENYTRVTTLVNDKLRERGKPEVDYNKVYRTVIETLSIARKSKEMSQTQAEKSYDDLTDKQRAVINEKVRDPGQQITKLARNAGVDPSYPQQVLEKYGHIAENMTVDDIEPVETDGSAGSTKSYNELTDLQREVVDVFVEHPDWSESRIADEVGCDPTYPGKISEKFKGLIKERQSTAEDEPRAARTITAGDETFAVSENIVEEYNGLTEKQKAVIDELLLEEDPTDPERTQETLGEDAGVHSTYVRAVIEKFGDLATRIKESEIEAPPSTEWVSEDEDESEPVEEPQSFSEQFSEVVENEEIENINVSEIMGGIGTVDDVELLEQALEQDSRKTSSSAFEDRIEAITGKPPSIVEEEPEEPEAEPEEETSIEETEEESEAEPEEEPPEEETSIEETGEEPEEPEVELEEEPEPVEVESESEASEGMVPTSELRRIQDRVEMLIRTAESEIKATAESGPAARAKSVSEEFNRMLDDAIESAEE